MQELLPTAGHLLNPVSLQLAPGYMNLTRRSTRTARAAHWSRHVSSMPVSLLKYDTEFVPVACYSRLLLPDVLMLARSAHVIADSYRVEFRTRSERRQHVVRNREAVSQGDKAKCSGEQTRYRYDKENRPQEYTGRPLYLWRSYTIGLLWNSQVNVPQNVPLTVPHYFQLRFSGEPPSLVH